MNAIKINGIEHLFFADDWRLRKMDSFDRNNCLYAVASGMKNYPISTNVKALMN